MCNNSKTDKNEGKWVKNDFQNDKMDPKYPTTYIKTYYHYLP